jgi:hypothetical protein
MSGLRKICGQLTDTVTSGSIPRSSSRNAGALTSAAGRQGTPWRAHTLAIERRRASAPAVRRASATVSRRPKVRR